ncbi:hypothetical protein [Aestuariivita boseongensis]|uniref:hypothetical protein n=1 Tax=Aestuariivita boseongensis TaxID=1470562 RepID=UPI000680489A|nr:hypothetical protein [Aestuariivita boseongensis]
MLVAVITGLAVLAGLFLPLRWGVFGFLGAATLLYLGFFALLAARGFEGLPLSESLLLFEGSTVAYLAFNLQVAYRAFALPVLVLAAVFVLRQQRKTQ